MAWYVDNVDLSTLAWNVKNRSAGWSVPNKVGENVRVPSRHGAFWTPNKTFDQGQLSLSMWAVGCNEDGSLPLHEDGRRKVRDNLDKLTALFANSRRLLTLRQETGANTAQVNELGNPTLVANGKSYTTLAHNIVKDSYRRHASAVAVSKNHSLNPFMRGRTDEEFVATEELYPDPGLWRWAKAPKASLLRSYYYPIYQNSSTTNYMYTPINGFTHSTGGHQGTFSRSTAGSLPANSWLGTFHREVWVPNGGRTVFLAQLRLASNAPASTVRVNVVPMASKDGVTWSAGTSSSTVTLNKDTTTWLISQANTLPANATGQYFVRYQLRFPDATTWNAGAAILSEAIAIQDAPRPNNPWVNNVDPSLMIVGGVTNYVTSRNTAVPAMGWSEFARPQASDWEVVQGTTQVGTSPYAYAWGNYVSSRNEGNVAFSVFGGTYQTFRRVLPTPMYTMTDQKVWGKFWRGATKNLNSPINVRITRRTGTAGAYTYTTVASTTISAANKTSTFTSGKFTTTPGNVYCLEFDVPAGSNGLAPSFTLREIHVSNGLVNTLMPMNFTSYAGDTIPTSAYTSLAVPPRKSAVAKYRGTIYQSAIEGRTYKPHGVVTGVPYSQAESVSNSLVDWAKQPQGVQPFEGVLEFPKETFSPSTNTLTVRLRGGIAIPRHLTTYPFRPTSTSATATITLYNSSGATTRTVAFTLDEIPSTTWKSWSHTVTPATTEVAASVKVTYSNASFPMSNLNIAQYHMMTDLPVGYSHFTGAASEFTATWPSTIRWDGTPYFSKTSMSVSLPNGWTVPGFAGHDSDNYSIRWSGGTLRVPILSGTSGTKYVGYRRGAHTSNLTVSAQPEGGTAVSLGTITSTQDWVAADINIPASATYVDFIVTGGVPYKTVKDVHVLNDISPILPKGVRWLGYNATSAPAMTLPSHPSSQNPTLTVTAYSDMTSRLRAPLVDGWTAPLVSGGYIPVPASGSRAEAATYPIPALKRFMNAAMILKVESDAVSKTTVVLQGATDTGMSRGQWSTLNSTTVVSGLQEVTLTDVIVPNDITWVRLAVVVDNRTSPITRTGAVAIIDGATLTPYDRILGNNFAGFFVGLLAADGQSAYVGHIRQAHVEVTEAIDMNSQAYGTIAEFNVNMTVPGAFWEDVYDTEAVLTGTGTSGTFYVDDFGGGTAPMQDLIITVEPISGTFTRFTLTDEGSGNRVTYNGPAQSKVIIDTALAEVRDSSGDSLIEHISGMGSSNIMSLTPYIKALGDSMENHLDGVPIMNWSADTSLKVTILGRRKYLIG